MELVALARNPIPIGATTGMFEGYDGAPLRFARWDATGSPRRGTVVVFEGRGEYIEKYFEVVADLRRRGFAVAIHDWRGQGGSHRALANPRKGHIRSFTEYDRDFAAFMKQIVLPDCPPPYYALAHSMGGNIVLRTAAGAGSWFERIVLCAPMLEIAEGKVGAPHGLARGYAETVGLLGGARLYVVGGSDRPEETAPFEGNALTSDMERCARNRDILLAAPQLGLGSATVGWLRAAYRSCAQLMDPAFAERVKVPILLVAAGSDRIVSTRAIETFAARLKVGALVSIPHAQHEILQETDAVRQSFWAAFDAYLGLDAAAA